MRGWIKAEADSADELQRLVRDARSWQEGKRGLLRQPELGVLLRWREQQRPTGAWAARHVQPADFAPASASGGRQPAGTDAGHVPPDDFALTVRYLEESRSDEERQRKQKEEARQRELEQERQRAAEAEAATRRQRKLARIAISVAAVAVISLAFA